MDWMRTSISKTLYVNSVNKQMRCSVLTVYCGELQSNFFVICVRSHSLLSTVSKQYKPYLSLPLKVYKKILIFFGKNCGITTQRIATATSVIKHRSQYFIAGWNATLNQHQKYFVEFGRDAASMLVVASSSLHQQFLALLT